MATNPTYQNELGSAMLPCLMRELSDTVTKQKNATCRRCVIQYILLQLVQGIIGRETQSSGIQVHYHFVKP